MVTLFGVVLILGGAGLLTGVVLGLRMRSTRGGRRVPIRRSALLAKTVPLRQVTLPAHLAELPLAPAALVAAVRPAHLPPLRVPNPPPAARGIPVGPPPQARMQPPPNFQPGPPHTNQPHPGSSQPSWSQSRSQFFQPVPASAPATSAAEAPTWDQRQWRVAQAADPFDDSPEPPRNDRSFDPARRPH